MATVSENLSLNIPLSADQRSLLEEAAALAGQPAADFAVSAVLEIAQRAIDGRRGIRLSDRDRDYFLSLFDNPPEPGVRLKRAAEQHRENIVQ